MAKTIPITPLTPSQRALVESWIDKWNVVAAVRNAYPAMYRAVAVHLDEDDIVQLSVLGVIRAAQLFQESRGVCFNTYAMVRIRGELHRFLRWRHRYKRDESTTVSGDEMVGRGDRRRTRLLDLENRGRIVAKNSPRIATDGLDEAVARLPKRSAAILSDRFGLGGKKPMSLKAVARRYGVTHQRISQIVEAACGRLLAILDR